MTWPRKLRLRVMSYIYRGVWRLRRMRVKILRRFIPKSRTFNDEMTVFQITHHKAASQWVAEVLKCCVAAERLVFPKIGNAHLSAANLRSGVVFLTVYAAREQIEAVTGGFHHPMRKFVVIRDLRDTLVSFYFSMRYSHRKMGNVSSLREQLAQMNLEDGLLYLLASDQMSQIAAIQLSWIHAGDRLLIRYEELVADEYAMFQRIMDYCQIKVEPAYLRKVVAAHSFEARTGRSTGQEDITAHQRKGITGDWRNYFTARVKAEFKARFDEVLIQTGYEEDRAW